MDFIESIIEVPAVNKEIRPDRARFVDRLFALIVDNTMLNIGFKLIVFFSSFYITEVAYYYLNGFFFRSS